ncbi:hypothetical protein [Francisella salimarina]|uniref:hypothetical protein n=1 Tax=Francisella salimarina TaxID=2599927 RepID=UPI003D814D31
MFQTTAPEKPTFSKQDDFSSDLVNLQTMMQHLYVRVQIILQKLVPYKRLVM